jgi:ABC-type transporter MlaC component
VSLVINYRSSFGHEIRRNGIDGLIQRLASKNLADNG